MPAVRSLPHRLALFCAAAALGCGSVYVRPTATDGLSDSWRASAVSCSELSPRSWQTLRRYDLGHLYPDHLEQVSAALHAEALRERRPDLLFTLAEVNYLRGRQAEDQHNPDASVYYYLSAGYAYHFLFDDCPPDGGPMPAGTPREAFDPRFRLACELYNAGLAKCIVAAQAVGRLDPRRRIVLQSRDGGQAVTLAVVHTGFLYQPDEFGPVQLCSAYQVVGLANHHRTYGLGVPLIGSRAADAPRPPHAYYPAGVNYPITAFFRFEGNLADLAERRAGWLELCNPLLVQAVQVRGRRVPLETDLTTPLACYLAKSKISTAAGYSGFFCPASLGNAVGLHSLEPYQPGKVPVVMVHGLLGTPVTWAPLFNDLQADPVLRRRFQFWVYFYPTGTPFLATAAGLRRDLARMRQALDPKGEDRALDDMVFVGHSMGGLVSRLMTVDSGDDFWKLVSPQTPLDRLSLTPGAREELQSTFYFRRQPFVTRAIFMATPHHGSGISPSVVGRLAARLAGLPRDVAQTVMDAAAENPQLAQAMHRQSLPSSVAELAPDSPTLQLIADRPRPRPVHYHSVVGVTSKTTLPLERFFGGGYSQPGDGVVPYASAHLDDVESELVVPADHYEVHHHPLAILEVRRILLEHLRDFDRRQPIQQVSATVPTSTLGR
jgi:pimeloyl-ACP methyl ester carboxylesterase